MHELNLDLHGLVRVWAPELSSEVYSGLQYFLGEFLRDEKMDLESLDVLLLPLASAKLKEALDAIQPSPYGMSFVQHSGENGIVFNFRGKPDLVLMLGERITVYYTPRKNNLRRIYGLLLFSTNLVLHKKRGLLYHGAAATKDNTALLLTGLRGAKKTQLLLTMLREGWNYLSDDKLIIQGGKMYTFQDLVPIADHHVAGLPWLYDFLPPHSRRQKAPMARELRRYIAGFSRRFFSKYFLPMMERIYDPQSNLKVQQIFPDCSIVESAVPSAVILLSLGDKVDCFPIESEGVLEEVTAIESLVFYSMGPLEQLVFFCNKSFKVSVETIIRNNLEQYPFYRLQIPGNADIEHVYQVLLKKVVSQVGSGTASANPLIS